VPNWDALDHGHGWKNTLLNLVYTMDLLFFNFKSAVNVESIRHKYEKISDQSLANKNLKKLNFQK
jgi:hypothetical protein